MTRPMLALLVVYVRPDGSGFFQDFIREAHQTRCEAGATPRLGFCGRRARRLSPARAEREGWPVFRRAGREKGRISRAEWLADVGCAAGICGGGEAGLRRAMRCSNRGLGETLSSTGKP